MQVELFAEEKRMLKTVAESLEATMRRSGPQRGRPDTKRLGVRGDGTLADTGTAKNQGNL